MAVGVLKAIDLKTAKVETAESVDSKGAKTKTTKWKTTQLASLKLPGVETIIQAGDRLYVSRPGEVLAFDVPLKSGAEPSWRAAVEGSPASLIAADGRLGSRLCFSAPRNIYQCSDGYIVLSGSANQVALRVFDAICDAGV